MLSKTDVKVGANIAALKCTHPCVHYRGTTNSLDYCGVAWVVRVTPEVALYPRKPMCHVPDCGALMVQLSSLPHLYGRQS